MSQHIDSDRLIGTLSYSDPETGSHFWYPMTSSATGTDAGWHVRKKASWTTSGGFADWYVVQTTSPDFGGDRSLHADQGVAPWQETQPDYIPL